MILFGNPVKLEPVEDMHLLGFDVDLTQRAITYRPPNAPWKIRGPPRPQLHLPGLGS